MAKIISIRRDWAVLSTQPYQIILSGTLVFLSCLGLGLLKQNPLAARDVTLQSATYQNPWQYASFPVENFQAYTSGFGYRTSPTTGARQFHYGLDLAAPLGSYVRSWWAGQVVGLSDHTACGTTIEIRSGDWVHIYCHLMGRVESTPQGRYLIDREGGIVIAMGQTIPAGARIARVGMTGRTTGPHLHWALKYNNNYVDPALVLQAMFQQTVSR
jgi:murein DD-endopeptidase MepM/ murein hydrolase activator NlpD